MVYGEMTILHERDSAFESSLAEVRTASAAILDGLTDNG